MKAALIAVVAIVAVVALWYVSTYNSLVSEREGVRQSWGQVENVYQRRADLIPNLVATVKGYAAHESGVFKAVAEARAKVGSVNVDASSLMNNMEAQKNFLAAQQGLGNALSHLIALQENYPTLKANENFLTLQSQLEGTENRIAVERGRNQKAIQTYNTDVQGFFTSIIARRNGFEVFPYFEAKQGSDSAPQVKF
ncbi:MAG TPA: LemA family protein [Candidatus Paceibacterota bacterium]|nr:LemA family protein [Candidatus Paceibacterota bacterium]